MFDSGLGWGLGESEMLALSRVKSRYTTECICILLSCIMVEGKLSYFYGSTTFLEAEVDSRVKKKYFIVRREKARYMHPALHEEDRASFMSSQHRP